MTELSIGTDSQSLKYCSGQMNVLAAMKMKAEPVNYKEGNHEIF
jgi:hypothetical protein